MDAVGDAVENVGLAQEIQKGLAKSLMKPLKFAEWQGEIDAKKAEFAAMDLEGIKKTRLGKNICIELGDAAGEKKELVDEVCAKYMVACEKVYAEPVAHKLFEEARALGKGAFGAVFLTFKKDTGAPFAVKKCVKTIAKKNHMLKDVLIEREVLGKMDSTFCVSLNYAYQDQTVIYLVLTLMPGGDLSFLLSKQYKNGNKKDKDSFTPLGSDAVKFYGASMACGLEAIHKAGYVYRDLKPQNVLLDAEGLVRISDMGLTANVTGGPIKQCSGTRGYWSPETIKKEAYTFEPDWWSLGVTMFVLFSDKMPFHGKTDEERDAASVEGAIEFKHGEPDDLQACIKGLCTIDITKRLGANGGLDEIKKDPFFATLNWESLENGTMAAPVQPNVNDINAPDKNEIASFVAPKDVTWDDKDQEQFSTWDHMNKELWYDEAMFRIKKFKELGGGGGGGGCCTIA